MLEYTVKLGTNVLWNLLPLKGRGYQLMAVRTNQWANFLGGFRTFRHPDAGVAPHLKSKFPKNIDS